MPRTWRTPPALDERDGTVATVLHRSAIALVVLGLLMLGMLEWNAAQVNARSADGFTVPYGPAGQEQALESTELDGAGRSDEGRGSGRQHEPEGSAP